MPDSSIPDELPHFVGRDKECKAIEHHLTDEVTRLVNIWGPPGFGKTSVAIRVAHHLQDKNFPAYFASVRGMKSMEDLVSKLLSIFVDDKQVSRISSSDLVIQCLQQIRNPFVLILDNADDLLESEDAKRKQHVLRFIEEIITHCKEIKLLLTTRESLDYLSHKLSIYLEKINVLDEISSAHLVRLLLPDALENDCKCVVRECGNVPMSMRLMCSIIKEANISINALLEELSDSTIVEVLNFESFPDDFRLKSVINTSFKRLMIPERNAFVSLSVFPEWFGIKEAQVILNVKSEVKTKQIIRSLERKSLIHCGDSFSRFTVHSLLRSFIKEEVKNDEAVEAVFLDAQVQFYDHYISRCEIANKNFLNGSYSKAFRNFLDRRECIISSLSNGPGNDRTYTKAVDLLSEAKSFLYVALHGEKKLFERLYDIAIEEAERREKVGDKKMLLSAKEFPLSQWYQPDTAKSYFWLGRVQREAGDLTTALESLQLSLRLRKELLGDHPDSAAAFHEQGVIHTFMGDYKSAVEAFQKATDINLNFRGDHIFTAHSYQSLGVAQKHMADLTGALDSFQRAANMRSSVLGDHEDTASSYHGLALVQRHMGDLKGALESVQVSLRMTKELLGDHLNTADSLYEQGVIHFAMGDFNLAVESLQKAADMNFNLRKHHMNTANNYHTLGMAQGNIQDYEGALDSLQKAIQIKSNLLGDHEDTASSYHKLGSVQRDMGDLKGAMDSLQRAANMRLSVLGDHKVTADSYHFLGLVQRNMGDLKGAMDSLQKAANMRLSVLGDHKDTASSFFELSGVQKKAGHLKSALDSVQVSLRMTKELLGDHLNTADSFYEQSVIHFAMGDFNLAVESLQKAADMNFNLRRHHINTAKNYQSLGMAQGSIQDYEGAVDSLQKAIQIKSNLLGDHEDTASCYHGLGLVQRHMGDLKGASDSLQKAANMRSNLLGDHKYTARSYHELGVVQHGMGDLKGALESLQKALDMRTHLFGKHGDTMSSLNELRAVQKKLSSGRSFFGKVFRRKNRHENNDKL